MKKERLNQIISQFKNKRVAVIGDLMLDVYIWGNATRISQEAPVPIVHVNNSTHCLGGAANVMRNLITLNAQVHAFGIIGQDQTGEKIINHLKEYGIVNHLLVSPDRPTTEKQRIIAGQQQVVRIDFENATPIPNPIRQNMVHNLKEMIEHDQIDGIIVEDYAKGALSIQTLQELCDCAQKKNIPIALDPHPGHPLEVPNLTLITPNRTEAFGLAGHYVTEPISPVQKDKALLDVAKNLKEKWKCQYLLITLGAQGMALFPQDEELSVIPTRAREVYDVSGAGDTVIAAFMLAHLSGATATESAEFANHAAGVVVGKVGTVAVKLNEVISSFEEWGLIQ